MPTPPENAETTRQNVVAQTQSVTRHNGLRAFVWHQAGTGTADQDRWLVTINGEGLRAAVIDGVTPWQSPAALGGDAGQVAAATVGGHLMLPVSPGEALRAANKRLHVPDLVPSRRQAMAAVAVADCSRADDEVVAEVLVAADCEVWSVNANGELDLVAGGDFLSEETRRVWEQERGLLPDGADPIAVEANLLDDPSTQVRHAVGRYPAPVWEQTQVRASALVLATDGCQFRKWASWQQPTLSGLAPWLGYVGGREHRGDLTAVLLEPDTALS